MDLALRTNTGYKAFSSNKETEFVWDTVTSNLTACGLKAVSDT